MKRLIEEILRRVPVQLIVGKVTAFDKDKGLADLTIEGGPDRVDVRIRAVADGNKTGILVSPKLNSYVLVAMIDNHPESSVLVGYSEIDEVFVNIPETEMSIAKDGFLLKKGSNVLGGLMNDLIDAITQITVTTGTGPSGMPVNSPSFLQIKEKFSQLLKTT